MFFTKCRGTLVEALCENGLYTRFMHFYYTWHLMSRYDMLSNFLGWLKWNWSTYWSGHILESHICRVFDPFVHTYILGYLCFEILEYDRWRKGFADIENQLPWNGVNGRSTNIGIHNKKIVHFFVMKISERIFR